VENITNTVIGGKRKEFKMITRRQDVLEMLAEQNSDRIMRGTIKMVAVAGCFLAIILGAVLAGWS